MTSTTTKTAELRRPGAAHVLSMSTNTDQPRGINGHKSGEFSERTFSAPDSSTTLTPTGDLGVYPANVLPGDIVFDLSDGEPRELGRATVIRPSPHQPGRIIIRLASGGAVTADPDDILSIHRDDVAPDYDEDANYYDKLAVAFHALTTAETLDTIAWHEAEDDFMFAVAAHQNSAPQTIEKASQHHDFTVRHAALANPTTATRTIQRIRRDAMAGQAAAQALHERQGINPNTSHTIWEISQQSALANAAAEVLETRDEK
jgi:hypothetical protein